MSACCLLKPAAARQSESSQGKGRARGKRKRSAPGKGERAKGKGKGKGNGFALCADRLRPPPGRPTPATRPDYFDNYMVDGKFDPLVAARWAANSPTVMVNQHVPALRSFDAFMIDIGRSDGLFASNEQLEAELSRLKIPHEYETYDGNHRRQGPGHATPPKCPARTSPSI